MSDKKPLFTFKDGKLLDKNGNQVKGSNKSETVFRNLQLERLYQACDTLQQLKKEY